jgi:hypothetical protein
MNDSLADILGIIVDGGTVIYVGYKTGRWVVANREKLIRRRRIAVGKDLDLRWRVAAPVRRAVELAGTIEVGSSMSGVVSTARRQEKPPAWEELLWWYLRVH